MKKICLLSIFMVSVLASLAQVDFKLQEGGYYAAPDGQDFIIVVQFDGKDAHQIYTTLLSNAQTLYNDFSKVGNTVDDTSITIRAISSSLLPKQGVLMKFGKYPTSGYYKLDFKIKDGRVRVSAPYIEDKIRIDHPTDNASCSFRDKVKKMYKNGQVKDGDKENILAMEYSINSIINAILYGLDPSSNNDDW